MVVTLRPKLSFKVPVDAECLTPDIFAGKSSREIAALKLREGNRERALGELFEVEGESGSTPKEVSIQVFGDVRKVRRVGAHMSAGEIVVHGDVGMHLGEEMTGGRIKVAGSADSWAGFMMKKGMIEIKGDAGDYVGAAYRGSTVGMSGGTIIIHGNAGNEVGCFMRKGLIKVYGNAGQFAGMHMRNGAILIQGNSEGRAGAEMTGGRIVICGSIPSILPTFTIDSVRPRVKVDEEEVPGPFYLFVGDLTEGGDGRLYVSQTRNPQLGFYEKYL